MFNVKQIFLLLCVLCFTPVSHGALTNYGAGNISDSANPAGYKCAIDHGNWIYSAGMVNPAVSSCNPIGTPTPFYPQRVAPASTKPTMTHRWWGSISFKGEMKIGNVNDAGYITPDPMTARITDRGVRIMGIPNGLRSSATNTQYNIPAPFDEVFDGLAIGNSIYANMDAYLKDYSDGSVTVQWNSGGTPVMEATFVHGSPNAYFSVFEGNLVVRTLRADSGEKGVFYQAGDSLGVWTDVAGDRNSFLITGHDATVFSGVNTASIGVTNASKRVTVTLLPQGAGIPSAAMIQAFAQSATQRIDKVNINYSVDRATNKVTVSHQYQFAGAPVTTMVGMLPLQWKNSNQAVTSYKVRSARGITKFALTDGFSYNIPFVGVLPYLPENIGDYDVNQLKALVTEFINKGEANWSTVTDTYWSGKNYGKVAELAAIARSVGMNTEADQLLNWLKAELQNWFKANSNGSLDTTKYFAYDSNWNSLLGFDESFGSQQQLNDHHFHYGYFVRAAAEICRVDASWCSTSQYGPMVELLIRDYAADRNDAMFPYLRNFDPAYGFSWASGHANFVLGNNNESTSEAANAYGAMVLYGQITQNQAITERGMYLHASSTSAYWEYWNNYDRFRGVGGDADNFAAGYPKMTTSIIWGNGHVFATWFSGAYAHILGIQGLPLSPLVFHIGQHADYLNQYVSLGLTESSNGKPSGLPNDQWRDVWWNILSMTDGQAAVNDMQTYGFNYEPEAGETKAHTYHWIYTLKQLGHLATGTGALTANSPSAVAFTKGSVTSYLAYNFTCTASLVTFSDGMSLAVPANGFRIKRTGEAADAAPTDTSCVVASSSSAASSASSTNSVASSANSTQASSTQASSIASSSGALSSAASSIALGSSSSSTASDFDLTTQAESFTASAGVDVVATLDFGGGQSVDNVAQGRWIAYADLLHITSPGSYQIEYRVASTLGSLLSSDLNGGSIPLGNVNIPATGGNQVWTTVTQTVTLNAGTFSFGIYAQQGGWSINWFRISKVTASSSSANSSVASSVVTSSTASSAVASSVSSATASSAASAYGYNIVTSTSVEFYANDAAWVDFHYTLDDGGQQNLRMTHNGDNTNIYTVAGVAAGTVVKYFFTVGPLVGGAFDTSWQQFTMGAAASSAAASSIALSSVASVPASSAAASSVPASSIATSSIAASSVPNSSVAASSTPASSIASVPASSAAASSIAASSVPNSSIAASSTPASSIAPVPVSSAAASSVPASSIAASSVPNSSIAASSTPTSSIAPVPASSAAASSIPASSIAASSVPNSSVAASSTPASSIASVPVSSAAASSAVFVPASSIATSSVASVPASSVASVPVSSAAASLVPASSIAASSTPASATAKSSVASSVADNVGGTPITSTASSLAASSLAGEVGGTPIASSSSATAVSSAAASSMAPASSTAAIQSSASASSTPEVVVVGTPTPTKKSGGGSVNWSDLLLLGLMGFVCVVLGRTNKSATK